MRILYLHQFFRTRATAGGTRSYELARHLIASGHEVVMVTAAEGPVARAYTTDAIEVREVGGVSSDYLAATARSDRRRIAGFARFAAGAVREAVRGPRPDVVLATSPPLTVIVPALAARLRHRAPLVFEVRDLWPRAPIEMGALEHPAARAAARALAWAAYRSASRVVALSPGMRDGVVDAGVDPARVTVAPNASDLDLFSPELDPGRLRADLGLGDAFVCSYFGAMGEANDLEQVIEAAALLEARAGAPRIAFVLQGEGKRRPALEAAIARRGLRDVHVRPAAGKAEAARLAAASDACLTIFKDVPVLATNSPNKLFDTFAAGRAAVVNTDGWQAELVLRHDAGVAARPGDPADLAEQIARLAADPERTAAMGANARRLAEEQFDRRIIAARVREVLERAAAERT